MDDTEPRDPEEPEVSSGLSWRLWLAGARLKTLPAAIAPVWLGSWLAVAHGFPGSWFLGVATLLSALAIQIATNYCNDAIDGRKGTDTKHRLGPERLTGTGAADWRQVLFMGITALFLAVLFSLPLVAERGWPILVIGILSLWFAYGYTGGPYPLAYLGLGEIFVIIFFGFVAVGGSVFVQSGEWLSAAWIAGLQSGLCSTVLIAINNLRDIKEDRKAGKLTLAARFGLPFGRWEITLLLGAVPLCGLLWLGTAWPWSALASCAGLPVAFVIAKGIWHQEPSPVYNRFLGLAALHLLLLTVALSISWIG